MSLFPKEDILTKEIESWKGFADGLPAEEDRETFMKMLHDCYKYAKAINAKAQPFPSNYGSFVFTAQNDRVVGTTNF
jgi:hypothetical protein